MPGLLTPILNEIQTALQATLNTEKDVLDNTLADIRSAAIRIEFPNMFQEEAPWVNIFPFGEFTPDEESNITNDIPWSVITSIVIDGDNTESLIKNVDVYTSAMLKSIIKHGADWTLNGTCDLVIPNSISPDAFFPDETGAIVIGNFIQWTFRKEYNLTS